MPKITKIEIQKRAGRYNIYLDDVYAFPVSEAVLIQFQLLKGQELELQQIETIKKADDLSKAYNQALNYLSYQLRSEKEMRQYLKKQEISAEGIEFTIDKLKDLKLIDDQIFATSMVNTLQNTSDKGPKVIQQKLYEKGIKGDLAQAAVAQIPFADQVEKGIKVAAKLQKRYHRDAFNTQLQKMKQQLMIKGYSKDVIDEIMSTLDLSKDEEKEATLIKETGEKLFYKHRKLTGAALQNKVKQALYQKGFRGEEINHYLDERVVEDE